MKKPDYDFIEFDNWKKFSKIKDTNDCGVFAIANLFDIHYSMAHKLCRTKLDREKREGTDIAGLLYEKQKTFYGKKITKVKSPKILTLAQFPYYFPIGRYIVNIKGHYISFIDGIGIGTWKPKPHKKIEKVFTIEK